MSTRVKLREVAFRLRHLRRSHGSSIDLVSAALALRQLLATVDCHRALYTNRRVLRNTLRRYEKLWLPLLSEEDRSTQTKMVAPLDVEWIWVCHMLSPSAYQLDVEILCGKGALIDHKLLQGAARVKGEGLSRRKWQERYPHEPFDVLDDVAKSPLQEEAEGSPTSTALSYDVVAAAGRQMMFYYQVALPHYGDRKFLAAAVERYLVRFLGLRGVSANTCWVPSYDIDLMWHAHMLHPVAYREDTAHICGSMPPHDDAMNDRAAGGELQKCWENTIRQWEEQYPADSGIRRNGCLWRGNPGLAEYEQGGRIEREWQAACSMMTNVASYYVAEEKMDETEEEQCPHLLPEIPWLHAAHIRRVAGESIERTSQLDESTEKRRLLRACVTHCVNREQGRVESVVEVMTPWAKEDGNVPLATAHSLPYDTLPESYNVGYGMRSMTRRWDEHALLLRVKGEDTAILFGRWEGFRAPRAGRPRTTRRRGVPGYPGMRGHLGLRAVALRGPRAGRSVPIRSVGGRNPSGPLTYNIDLGVLLGQPDIPRDVAFDLSEGTIRSGTAGLPSEVVIPAYLVLLSSAVLHVSAQPCFRPDDLTKGLYPPWTVEQQKHVTLRAAGGEDDELRSFGALSVQAGYRAYDGSSATSRRVPAQGGALVPAASGCGGCGGGGGGIFDGIGDAIGWDAGGGGGACGGGGGGGGGAACGGGGCGGGGCGGGGCGC